MVLNGGNVGFFLNLIKNKKWKTYYLNNNYRCGQKIIDVSNTIIKQANDIIDTEVICKSNTNGEVIIDSKYKIDQYLKNIYMEEDYKDWFILVRTNKDIYKLEQKLIDKDIPYVSFKKGDLTLQEMKQLMNEDKVKLLTIHASKGLESKNVLLWGNFPIQERPYMRNSDERKVLYVGVTRRNRKGYNIKLRKEFIYGKVKFK